MSHNIQELDSVVATEKTWHGLETIVEKIGLENSGLDWLVTEKPAYFHGAKGALKKSESVKVLVRQSDFEEIAVVKTSYGVIQNSRIWEVIQKSLDGIPHQVTCALSMGNLQKICVSLRLTENDGFELARNNGTMDKFLTNLNFCSSHDGSIALHAYDSAIRVVCQNTLNYSLAGNSNFRIKAKHTSNNEPQIVNMEKQLEKLFELRLNFLERLKSLDDSHISYETAAKAVIGFINTGEISTNGANRSKDIVERFIKGDGNFGVSRYDLLNGFTESYTRDVTGGNPTKKFMSSEFGSASKTKVDFYDALMSDAEIDKLVANGEKLLALDMRPNARLAIEAIGI